MNWLFLSILLISNLISHRYVFFDQKILLTGDWTYFFPDQLKEFANYYLYSGFLNLGIVYPFPGNSVFYHLYYFLNSAGISYDLGTRIIFLLPIIILTPIFSYSCFAKLLDNKTAGFFAASLYTFNSFFLKLQTDFLTWAFTWWLLPALILSIAVYLESHKSRYLFINSVLVFLAIAFEIRFAILILVFAASFVVFESRDLKKTLILITSLGIGGLLHLFWIMPMVFTNVSASILSYASVAPFVSFYTIKDVLALRSYQWSHNFVLEPFIRQPFELRNYLVILPVFIGIISRQGQKLVRQHRLVFVTAWATVLVFLGKQELLPFPEVYGWLFHHVPLFNLYRESSKFLILVTFCLSLLFGVGLLAIYEKVKTKSRFVALGLTAFLLFITTFYNLEHFLDQKVGGMTKGIEAPEEYKELEKFLSNDENFYRILWVPTRSDFGFNSNVHPALNAADLTTIYKKRVNFVLFDGTDLIQNQLVYLLNQEYSPEMLNAASVRYIIVPSLEPRATRLSATRSETVYKYFEFYGPRESFVTFLDGLSYLKKIELPGINLAVYENVKYLPHFSSVNGQRVDFVAVSPTEYQVNLTPEIKKLYFSESYNQNWLLVKNDCDWWKVLTKKTQCIVSASHTPGNYNLNEYEISSDLVLGGQVKLYFYPQVYVHLGLYLSVILLITYTVLLWALKKNEKNSH